MSLTYSSAESLSDIMQIVKADWRRLLRENASNVDIGLVSETPANLTSSDGSSIDDVHDISYLVYIQSPRNDLNGTILRAQFETMLLQETVPFDEAAGDSKGITVAPVIHEEPVGNSVRFFIFSFEIWQFKFVLNESFIVAYLL